MKWYGCVDLSGKEPRLTSFVYTTIEEAQKQLGNNLSTIIEIVCTKVFTINPKLIEIENDETY